MKYFLLLASLFAGIIAIALPPTGLSDSLLPRNDSPKNQFSPLNARQFLGDEAPDDSLWLDTGDVTDFSSDPLLFADNTDIASSPTMFDEASAASCGGTQSSLDPITELSGLNARDLSDQFPGLQDLSLRCKSCQARNALLVSPVNSKIPNRVHRRTRRRCQSQKD